MLKGQYYGTPSGFKQYVVSTPLVRFTAFATWG